MLSRTIATPRRPLGSREAGLELPVPSGQPRRGRIGCHRRSGPRETVTKYPPPVDPDSHTVQSHPVGAVCFAGSVEVADAVVTRASYRRSSV